MPQLVVHLKLSTMHVLGSNGTDFDACYFTVAEGLLAMDCFRICDVRDRTLSDINKMSACSGPL